MNEEGDYVLIHTAPNPTEHLLMRSMLEGRGIDVRLEGTNPTGTYPDAAGSLASSELYVLATDADKARTLIEAADKGDLELKSHDVREPNA